MRTFRRVARLSVRLALVSRTRVGLLALLVAVAMTVFLVVSELSRVSSVGLDEAIAADIGETGSYVIGLPTTLGLGPREIGERMERAVGAYAAKPLVMIETLPPVVPECPPYEALGRQGLLVLRDVHGAPLPLPFGASLPVETELCIGGQVIPADALYFPTQGELTKWGLGLAIDARYRQLAALTTTEPITYRFSLVTGEPTDRREGMRAAVAAEFETEALEYGINLGGNLYLDRVDEGAGVREASEGIKLVYDIIGWGVLVLGGLGLLVSELTSVRHRTWFFGLARAVGARSSHVVGLVVGETVLILAAGTVLAVFISAAVQPVAASFARSAFEVDVALLQASTVPRIVAAALLVLALAGVYPALVAIRQDPLDVLEPRAT